MFVWVDRFDSFAVDYCMRATIHPVDARGARKGGNEGFRGLLINLDRRIDPEIKEGR